MVPMEELSPEAALAECARIARDLAATSGVSCREAFESLRDSLRLVEKARAEGEKAGRDRAADAIAAYVERQSCCGAPSICGATCQDSAEADAIARAAKPLAELIRTWKLVDRAKDPQ